MKVRQHIFVQRFDPFEAATGILIQLVELIRDYKRSSGSHPYLRRKGGRDIRFGVLAISL